MNATDTAGTARGEMTMDDGEHREIARLIGDLRRAERERDDLAATLETRNAEHAAAMARVAELVARLAEAVPADPRARAGLLARAGERDGGRVVTRRLHAACPVCQRAEALRPDGTMLQHTAPHPSGPWRVCPGTGRDPGPDGRWRVAVVPYWSAVDERRVVALQLALRLTRDHCRVGLP